MSEKNRVSIEGARAMAPRLWEDPSMIPAAERTRMNPLRLVVFERGDGDLEVQFTYSYRGNLPKKPEREKAVQAMLRRTLDGFEAGGAEYGGFSQDDRERLRRDTWIVTSEKSS